MLFEFGLLNSKHKQKYEVKYNLSSPSNLIIL